MWSSNSGYLAITMGPDVCFNPKQLNRRLQTFYCISQTFFLLDSRYYLSICECYLSGNVCQVALLWVTAHLKVPIIPHFGRMRPVLVALRLWKWNLDYWAQQRTIVLPLSLPHAYTQSQTHTQFIKSSLWKRMQSTRLPSNSQAKPKNMAVTINRPWGTGRVWWLSDGYWMIR